MATTTINDLLHHYREMSTDPTDFVKCFEVLTRSSCSTIELIPNSIQMYGTGMIGLDKTISATSLSI